jgi:plastocyanin
MDEHRRGRLLPTVLLTAAVTTALNVLGMAMVGRGPADRRGQRLIFTDPEGNEQVAAELSEGPGEIVFLTLAHNGDRARIAVRPTGAGALRVSVVDGTPSASGIRPKEGGSISGAQLVATPPAGRGPTHVLLPAAADPPAPLLVPLGVGGRIKGRVHLTGPAPTMEALKRTSDPFCAQTPVKDEQVIENANHTLRNVLVHLNGAPPIAPPAELATLTQDQCMYRPRVQGVVAGQTLSIRNGDRTLHNVHTYKGASTLFNQAQVPGTPAIEKKLTDDGALLKFKCDVHPWMTGFVWVQNNPFFAVTGDDGTFEIKGVPEGKYEIEAWHERFGVKKQVVAVGAKVAADVTFEFGD